MESRNLRVVIAKKEKQKLLWNVLFDNKIPRLIKKNEKIELLSNLELKAFWSKFPLLVDVLFKLYKMNGLVNRFFVSRGRFMPEMQIRQTGCAYTFYGPFNKNKERTHKR